MKWNLSTFRAASFQSIVLLYSCTIYLAVAAQLVVYVPSENVLSYILVLAGLISLIFYGYVSLGWTIPRGWFLTATGAVSAFAVYGFKQNNTTVIFALVCLAGMIICLAIGLSLAYTDKCLSVALKNKRTPTTRRKRSHESI